MDDRFIGAVLGWFFAVLILGMIILGMIYIPRYRVYKQDLQGKANLKQQEREKQIMIEEAKAEKESATLKALAEIERAKGVAQSNKIIADGLKNNEEYLRYLWIEGLKDGSGERIYIPTEAGLPILEARSF